MLVFTTASYVSAFDPSTNVIKAFLYRNYSESFTLCRVHVLKLNYEKLFCYLIGIAAECTVYLSCITPLNSTHQAYSWLINITLYLI